MNEIILDGCRLYRFYRKGRPCTSCNVSCNGVWSPVLPTEENCNSYVAFFTLNIYRSFSSTIEQLKIKLITPKHYVKTILK